MKQSVITSLCTAILLLGCWLPVSAEGGEGSSLNMTMIILAAVAVVAVVVAVCVVLRYRPNGTVGSAKTEHAAAESTPLAPSQGNVPQPSFYKPQEMQSSPEGSSSGGFEDAGEDAETVFVTEMEPFSQIVFQDINDPSRRFEADIWDSLSIGRDANNDVVVDYDRSVSHHQMEIRRGENGFYLVNYSQTNGTRLNGNPVDRPVIIQSGDVAKMGRVELRIEIFEA